MKWQLFASCLSRRAMLGATAVLSAGPALAEECRLGPAPHEKGARVFMDMDQQELDASYDQLAYEPLLSQITKRLASNSEAMRARIGAPERESYGPSAAEGLDIYRTKRENAPIFVFIHGGAWLGGAAKDYGYPAEMFVNAGAHYVAVDFIAIKEAGGDLGIMAKQVRSRRRLGPQERSEIRRRPVAALCRRPFLRWSSLRRGAGHRLAEGIWARSEHH